MRELCTTERYVRALIADGKRDRVVHVVSKGHLPVPGRVGAVPVMILADHNTVPHLSLAVCSAIDVWRLGRLRSIGCRNDSQRSPATC